MDRISKNPIQWELTRWILSMKRHVVDGLEIWAFFSVLEPVPPVHSVVAGEVPCRYARYLVGNLRVVAFCAASVVHDLLFLSSAKNQLKAVKGI